MNEQTQNESSGERDYSKPVHDDFDALSRDLVPVRSLIETDLDQIIRIDRRITNRDRSAYLQRKTDEALQETGVRISLVAEKDERVVGFIMAKVDYGEFGQTDTVAVIDTIGVDPLEQSHNVGRALVSQLLRNLASLRVDTVRTEVRWQDFGLNRFLAQCGFNLSQRVALSLDID
ncbi:MAG: GNAT family N-acetyltransferase [Arenicellales bacterium]|nr:GNAT family N-acetyltransferase [Arenicellales bacterium]